ncbi:terminase small subunit [Thermoproteota archaeon]
MNKLSIKQLKFVQNYFENGGNASKAALDAGFSEMHGRRLIQNATFLTAIEEIKKKNGLTEEILLARHLQLLHAKNENVQLGALKLAYEIKGKLKQKDEHSDRLDVHSLTPEERKARLDDLRKCLLLK